MRFDRSDGARCIQRILLVNARDNSLAPLFASMERASVFEARVVGGLAEITPFDLRRSDVFLVWYEHLQDMNDEHAGMLVQMSRSASVIVLLTVDTFLAAANTLRLGDAWFLVDLFKDYLEEAIVLSGQGYSITPAQIGRSFSLDRFRSAIADGLSTVERQVLAALGAGQSNRTIAAQLGITETQVKMSVRTVMHKMQFVNRTEAAVFVTRHRLATK